MRAAQRKQVEEANERKRQETEARINAAKQAQADSLKEQLEMFAEKERKSQEKREQFDKMRHEKQEELRIKASEKGETNSILEKLMGGLGDAAEGVAGAAKAHANADQKGGKRVHHTKAQIVDKKHDIEGFF